MQYAFENSKRGLQFYKESVHRKGEEEKCIRARREVQGKKRKDPRRAQGGDSKEGTRIKEQRDEQTIARGKGQGRTCNFARSARRQGEGVD
jgi:hypothetical protein